MFPNLMAGYEDDKDVFPVTHEALFLGGPEHGKWREVVEGDPVFKVISKAEPASVLLNDAPLDVSGGMVIHTYIKRDLTLPTQDGTQFVRPVYVHEEVESPLMAQRLLMAALLDNFIRGGRKVIDSDVTNTRGASGG